MHIEHMHNMIEKLTECTKSAIESNASKVGDYPISMVIDMIKDLSEAEYYSKISKAMEKADEDEKDEEKYMLQRMKEEYGEDDAQRYYNDWRYANGRFAPKGRGTRRGYRMTPEMYHMYPAEYYRDMDREDGMMYYSGSGSSRGGQSGIMSGGSNRSYSEGYNDGQSRGYDDGNRRGYDEGYNKGYSEGQRNNQRDYREGRSGERRRSYMETKEMHRDGTPESKAANMKELERYMNELSSDIVDMVKEASPEERAMARTKLQTLAQKMQ